MNLKPLYKNLTPVKPTFFKTEWNEQDKKKVNRAIKNLFAMQTLTDHNGRTKTLYTMGNIEEFFGLPYTSSSSFAMISNTNTLQYVDIENKYNIEYFALTTDNVVVMSVWDEEENEIFFKL